MKIYQIEITNDCNFDCWYCPRTKMTRRIGYMDYDILSRVMDVIENDTLVLHHYGESLLDSNLEAKIRYIKQRKPDIKLILNTNGSLLNSLRVRKLVEAGLDKIIISWHNERSLDHIRDIELEDRKRIEIIKMTNEDIDMSFYEALGYKTKIKRLRDLGQVKAEKLQKGNPKDRCAFLKNNEVVILWNGYIVPCCECYDDGVVLGNILKDDKVNNKAFRMCDTCLGYGNYDEETEKK